MTAKLRPFGNPTKLRPFGSTGKLRSFGGAQRPDPLAEVRADIEKVIAEQDRLNAEEMRLFEIVDKYDLRGKHDSNEAWEARREWNLIWKHIDRNNQALHGYVRRLNEVSRNGRTP